MRSLPIFFACVSTWRYRLSRAATPTVSRSVTPTPCVAVCNTVSIVPVGFAGCVSRISGLTLCADFAEERGRVQVVDEGTFAVDLDHRQPLAVARLQLRIAADVDLEPLEVVLSPELCQRLPRTFAEAAVLGVVHRDATDTTLASSPPRQRAGRRARTRRAACSRRAPRGPAMSPGTPCRRSPSASR